VNEKEIWKIVLDNMKVNNGFTDLTINLWFSRVVMKKLTANKDDKPGKAYFSTDNDLIKNIIDAKYSDLMRKELNAALGFDVEPIIISCEKSTFEELRGLTLPDKEGFKRGDLVLPTPEEYFSICKRYGKVAVFELKNRFLKEHIGELVQRIKELEMLENTVFISFFHANLVDLKAICPEAHAQYLSYREIDEKLIAACKDYDLGLDVRHDRLNEQTVAMLKQAGVEINCWTVDDPARAEELISLGVDYITTNILE
jgi:glycerophosphoryl diester phosphodiesterase